MFTQREFELILEALQYYCGDLKHSSSARWKDYMLYEPIIQKILEYLRYKSVRNEDEN